ncbi:MAG: DUF1015 domain-containing protein [Butyrivibrio sp.]|nr:DUF1015 domain-containing protein [Butyrivibrio sp.]
MAKVKPFKAYRPTKELISKVAALPYDVYSSAEAREIVKDNPLSFLNIDRAETQFPEGYDMYSKEVYEKARDLLWNEIEDGVFIQDTDEYYYIYEQTMNGRTQTGIVGLSSIDDYLSGVIKKHENTREDKEIDRINHVDTCNAQTGPIFLCYRNDDRITQILNKTKESVPVYDFVSEGNVLSRVWIIDQKDDIDAVSKAFSEMEHTYIADGHHRCASAVKVGLKRRESSAAQDHDQEYDFFLSVLFPDKELQIMDYNRVVKDLNGLRPDLFLARLKEKFVVTESDVPVRPDKKGNFGMYLDEKWYILEATSDIIDIDVVEGLDVSILQNEVLYPILGIKDPRTDKRIDFIGGIRGLDELEKRCHEDMRVAFSMHPTSIDELFAVADQGRLMPPKSTWFEPKLLSGMFIHALS